MTYGALYVVMPDGRTAEVELDLPAIVLGRAAGSGIVLDDLSVSRRHARFTIESGHLIVEDLGSASGTFVGGFRIPAGEPSLVEVGQEVMLGDVVVRYAAPEFERVLAPAAATLASLAQPLPRETDEEQPEVASLPDIRAVLTAPLEPIMPGNGATLTLALANRANVVDQLAIVLSGLPPAWIESAIEPVALLPGAEATVAVALAVPRSAAARAGVYDVQVTVTSQETGHEVLAYGTIEIAPFEASLLSLHPLRARRDFVVAVENGGNAPMVVDLAGADDEEAFRYDFAPAVVTVPPGETVDVPLRVRRPRKIYGPQTVAPFQVMANIRGRQAPVEAQGQLAVRPILRPFAQPILISAAMVIGIIALLTLFFVPSDNTGVGTANAEAPYAGVHMCEKGNGQQAQQLTQAQETQAQTQASAQGVALFPGSQSGAPYFAQNNPAWGQEEYAKAKDPDFGPDWCGTTIEQCGCAMTSVTTVMAILGVIAMPDGKEMTPSTVNEWFNRNARKTSRGWVSQGFIYGDVIWTAANQLSGEVAKEYPGSPTVRFVRTGTGSDEEVRSELKKGHPVVLEVPGHWIAAVGLEGDRILINDPFYRDRKYLDTAYPGKVKSSVLFEPSEDLSAVVISVPKDVRVRVTDKEGRVVGTLNTGSADEAAKTAQNGIPGASYSTRTAWRDPTCVESAPGEDDGTNQIFLPGSKDDYKIEVLDASGGNSSVAIHSYDSAGTPSIRTIDSNGNSDIKATLGFDPASGAQVRDIQGGTATDATPAPETTPAPAQPSETAAATTAAPSPTPTNAPPPPLPTQAPAPTTSITVSVLAGDTIIPVATQEGFTVGDRIVFAPGRPNEEENTIAGFGSIILATPLRFAHSPGETIQRRGASAGGAPGGAGPSGVTIPPPTPPSNAALACSTLYIPSPKSATLICSATVTGAYTTTRWTVNAKEAPEFTGRGVLIMKFSDSTPVLLGFSACNVTACKAASSTQAIDFAANGGDGVSAASAGGNSALSSGATQTTLAPPVAPVAPPTGVAVDCNVAYDQQALPTPKATIQCAASFQGAFTTIAWSAPEATSPKQAGATFSAEVTPNNPKPDASGVATVTVTASFCNFGACTTSVPKKVGINYASVLLSRNPESTSIVQGSLVTLFGLVTGPVSPAGGTVQFYDGPDPLGQPVPIFEFPGIGLASLPGDTSQAPLNLPIEHQLTALYSGGTNSFGASSEPSRMLVTLASADVCDGEDQNRNGLIDEECHVPGEDGISGAVNIAPGTTLDAIAVSAGSSIVPPNDLDPSNVYWKSHIDNKTTIIVPPNTSVDASGLAARDAAQCASCQRQAYLGYGANVGTGFTSPTQTRPACMFSDQLTNNIMGTPKAWSGPKTANALRSPSTPGLYYLRAAGGFSPSGCASVQPSPPDLTAARVVVQGASKTTIAPPPDRAVLAAGCKGVTGIKCYALGDTVAISSLVEPGAAGTTGIPAGDVKLHEASGPDLLAPGSLNSAGAVTVPLDTGILWTAGGASPLRDYTLFGSYRPQTFRRALNVDYPAFFTTSTSSTGVTFRLTGAVTTTSLTGPATTVIGASATFVASVHQADNRAFGQFAGNVELWEKNTDGTTSLVGLAAAAVTGTGDPTQGDTATITGNLTLPVGTHKLYANYVGGGNYASSDSSATLLTVVVTPAPTTITSASVTAVPSPIDIGGQVTLAATVAPGNVCKTNVAPDCGALLGSIQFFDGTAGGTLLGTITASAAACSSGSDAPCFNQASGQAFLKVTTGGSVGAILPAGDHFINARYVPAASANYSGIASSCAQATPCGQLTVNTSATTISVTSCAFTSPATSCTPGASFVSPVNLSDKITFRATVNRSADYGAFSGNVRFCFAEPPPLGTAITSCSDSNPGLLGTGAVDPATGIAQITVTTSQRLLSAEDSPFDILATFTGGANYGGSDSARQSLTVTPAPATVDLAITPSPAPLGTEVTLSATLSVGQEGSKSGVMVFCRGTALCVDAGGNTPEFIASKSLGVGAGGVQVTTAQFDTGTFGTPGTYTFSAHYRPPAQTNYSAANGSASLVVSPATTTTTLALSPSTIVTIGNPLSFDVTIAKGPGLSGPFGDFSGTVALWERSANGTDTLAGLASATVAADGSATITGNLTLPVGTHALFAKYSGGGNYALSDSSLALLTVTVRAAPTAIAAATVDVTPDTVEIGTQVTIEALVRPTNACNTNATSPACGPLTGTIQFFDGATGGTSLGCAITWSTSVCAVANAPCFNQVTGQAFLKVTTSASTLAVLPTGPHPAGGAQPHYINARSLPACRATDSGPDSTCNATSTCGSLTVNPSTTTLPLTSCSYTLLPCTPGASFTSPVDIGNKIIFRATVNRSANYGAFGGTVRFCFAQTPPDPVITSCTAASAGFLGNATVNTTTGIAQITVTTSTTLLSAENAPYDILASYTGDGNYAASNSDRQSLDITPAATDVTLTIAPSPAPLGTSVTLTATIDVGSQGIHSGTVYFCRTAADCSAGGFNLIDSDALRFGPGGVQISTATFDTGSLTIAGSYTFSAYFKPPAKSNYRGANDSETLTVTPATTTTTLSLSPTTATTGGAVTLTAVVAKGAGLSGPFGNFSGAVRFCQGNASCVSSIAAGYIGTASSFNTSPTGTDSGKATLTLSSGFDVGQYPIYATYVPDASSKYAGSSSAMQLLTITGATTGTTLTVNSPLVGQVVTLSATVDSPQDAGNVTGRVNFCSTAGSSCSSLSTTYIGCVSSAGDCPDTTGYSHTFSAGSTATYLLTIATPNAVFPPGTAVDVRAFYSGGGNYNGSVSGARTVTVTKAATATTVDAVSPNPVIGANVTLTARVSSPDFCDPTNGYVGTLDFYDGPTKITTTAAAVSQGTCGGAPTFGAGSATFTTSATLLAAGAHSITAVFNGNAIFAASAAPASATVRTVTIDPAPTTITSVTAFSSGTILTGSTVTLGATVAPAPPSTFADSVRGFEGRIDFFVDAAVTPVASQTVPASGGAASATVSVDVLGSAIGLGAHIIKAKYVPAAVTNYAASPLSTVSADITVKASSDTALVATSPVAGQPVVLTASVNSTQSNVTVAGRVNFCTTAGTSCTALSPNYIGCVSVASDCPAVTGYTPTYTAGSTATFALSIATPNVTFIPAVATTVRAQFAGDAAYNGSLSNTASVTVQKASSSVSVDPVSPNPVVGSNVTLTARVTSPQFCDPVNGFTGTLDFFDGTTKITSSPVTVTAGTCGGAPSAGVGTATLTSSATLLAAGDHSITGVFNGNGIFAASAPAASATPRTVTVNAAPTSISAVSATSPDSPILTTSTVTLQATATSAFVDSVRGFEGHVDFFVDGSPTPVATRSITANGGATSATASVDVLGSAIGLGTHTIRAQFLPVIPGNYVASPLSTVNASVVVTAATSTSIAYAPGSSSPIQIGGTVTLRATVTSTATVTGAVDFYNDTTKLTTTGAVTVNGSGQADFTLASSASSFPAGTYTKLHAVFVPGTGSNLGPSTSSDLSLTVTGATTTLTLTVPSTVPVGTNFSVSASVAAGPYGNIAGNVKVYDGSTTGTLLVTCALPGNAAPPASPASCGAPTSALAPGSHTIVGVFESSSANYANSATATASGGIVIEAVSTTLTLTAPAAVTVGGSISLPYSISPSSVGAISGTVKIYEGTTTAGGTLVADCAISAASGSCSLPTVSAGTVVIAPGSHTYVARFVSTAANYANSGDSTSVSATVNQAAAVTLTTPTVTPSTFAVNASVTFSTTIGNTVSGVAVGGIVQFRIYNSAGAEVNNYTVTTYVGGVASIVVNFPLVAGNYTVRAEHFSDPNYATTALTAGSGSFTVT